MENTTYVALSRQIGLRREMDIVAHNIANADTPAFKAERLVFREFLAEPTRSEDLSFVQDVGTARDLSAGHLTTTGNDFDLALAEEGYFVIDTPLGERFTRHGRFQLDANGVLVTGEGFPVQGQGGEITVDIDGGQISVAPDGTISNDEGIIAQLRVVTFEDEQQLRKAANGLFSAPPEVNPAELDNPGIVQGMIEESNVQAVLEMTRMIQIARSHDSVARFIKREDDRVKDMIDKLGRPPSSA
jgi:flagellar basal-body rod protein FlgF